MTEAEIISLVSDWGRYALSAIVGGGIGAWATLARRDREVADAVSALGQRVTAIEARPPTDSVACERHDQRIRALEHVAAAMPTPEQIVRTHARIDMQQDQLADIRAGVGEIRGAINAIQVQLEMLSRHLLEHGPRSDR